MTERKGRIILAKFGLDSHNNGIKIVAKWLQEAGYEVIYMGIYNTAESIIRAALEEDADIIGGSFLGGEHIYYVRQLLKLAEKNKMEKVKFIVGGVIPPQDVLKLKELGVQAVFTPGTPKNAILKEIERLFGEESL